MYLFLLLISVIVLICGLLIQNKLSMRSSKWYYIGKITTVLGIIATVVCIILAM